MATTGWENLSDEGGIFELLSLDHSGDGISFFRQPRPTMPDGTLVAGIDSKVEAISAWMASNAALTVSPATQVPVGGLNGQRMDFAIAPGTESHPSDCPVQVCVLAFIGRDPSSKPTWQWDWGSAGPERQRLFLLAATDGVVAIFVDSLDGTTFDALTRAADEILATVKFDGT